MESRVDELRKMGIDIDSIIKGSSDKELLKRFHKIPIYSDVVIPEWTEEDISAFSNRIYNIVIKYKKD